MIILYSATGNTRYVAERLALRSKRCGAVTSITDSDAADISCDDEVIVWATPIYAWGLPAPVLEYIRSDKPKFSPRARHYLVATCGDDCGLTDKQWRREIEARGHKAAGAWSVQMPNTYVAMPGFDVDSEQLAADKIERSLPRIDAIAAAIDGHNDDSFILDCVRGSWPWFKSHILRPVSEGYMTDARKFSAGEQCTHCGSCAKACPAHNITVGPSAGPQWGSHCYGCLACYHACPEKAIAWGRATKGKGQYSFKRFVASHTALRHLLSPK